MLIVRILESKRIGNSIEHRKQAGYIHRLGNLLFRPSYVAQLLHNFRCRSIGMTGHQFDEFHERPILDIEARASHIACLERLDDRVVFSLQLQEIAVRANSVGTMV